MPPQSRIEQAVKDTVHFKFELFIADNAANSVQAVANLRAICKAHLPERYEIELVDVFAEPRRALEERIFMTPTLIIVQPGPSRRLVGNLRETAIVLHTLGLEATG
jgi:circadian clock protein KaiB